MAHWYYYNKNGEKSGPISVAALKALAQKGLITRETKIENHTGRTAIAGEVNGLTFPEAKATLEPPAPPTLLDNSNLINVAPPTGDDVYGFSSPAPDPFGLPSSLTAGDNPFGNSLDPFNLSTSFPIEQSPFAQPASMPGSFCSSCGSPIAPSVRFCSGCGSPTNTSIGGFPQQGGFMSSAISPQSGGHPLGKVLASSNGKGTPGVYGAFIGMLILAVFTVFVFYNLTRGIAIYAESTSVSASELNDYNSLANNIFGMGFVISVAMVIAGVSISRNIARSEITVYENGVTGMAGFLKQAAFQLTYDKIARVKVSKNTIKIKASGASYACHTQNHLAAAEIQRVIAAQQHKR